VGDGTGSGDTEQKGDLWWSRQDNEQFAHLIVTVAFAIMRGPTSEFESHNFAAILVVHAEHWVLCVCVCLWGRTITFELDNL